MLVSTCTFIYIDRLSVGKYLYLVHILTDLVLVSICTCTYIARLSVGKYLYLELISTD